VNHLAHLALAGDDYLVGSFLGDYIKGRLNGTHPDFIERGIRLHRAIDAFTDNHRVIRQSADRFNPAFRRYAGIMTDVFYDYMLANTWHDYYDTPLTEFSRCTLSILLEHEEHLTTKAAGTAKRMRQHNSLAHYGNDSFLDGAFQNLAGRLTRSNPLADAGAQCRQHKDALARDFAAFYPELIAFCENWKQAG
jgi:acyl carrier protein phosphodiesterase